MRSEQDIQNEIMEALKKSGYMTWKNHLAGVKVKGFRVPNRNKGMPDICAIKNGVTHYIEAKSLKGILSQEQIKWHIEAYKHGCIVHTATSIDEISHLL